MSRSLRLVFLAAALGLAAGGVAWGQDPAEVARLQAQVSQLKRQNDALARDLAAANQREKESADALARINLRLEALGKKLLDDDDDRLVEAVSDYHLTRRRLETLEAVSLRLAGTVQAYLKTALASDPDARAQVEAHLRELEVALELRGKPQKNVLRGNLQNAKVVSIDPESGMIVLNVGENENARIGFVFNIMRGDQLIGEAMVTDIRSDICGLFVQRLENDNDPVRFGDIASLKAEYPFFIPWKFAPFTNTPGSRPRRRGTWPVKSRACRCRMPSIPSTSRPRRPPS